MTKLLAVMTLAALALVIACGGGERLTVREYAEACGDLITDTESVPSALDALENAVSGMKKLNPPEELQRLHDLQVDAAEFGLKSIKEVGLEGLMEDMAELNEEAEELSETEAEKRLSKLMERMEGMQEGFEKFEAESEKFEAEVEEATSDLSPTTRGILSDEGCQ